MSAPTPSARYRTAPVDTDSTPGGVPYIIGNEAAERFSFYGMRAILVIFMTRYLLDASGATQTMGDDEAKTAFHLFTSAVYFTPLLGALVADAFLGKYRTIILLSLVYCAGHVVLAVDATRFGLALGLGLISLGSGGIKPCVSAHVGDQFGLRNASLLQRVFAWFYFSINLGAFTSMLLTPVLLNRLGPHVAFGVPGGLMFLATLVFWLGRRRFVHIPPGGRVFVRQAFSREGLSALGRLAIIYAFVAMFWALFDQTGSAWVLQAEKMDRHFLGVDWLPSQIGSLNPVLVMLLIPLFDFVVYPAVNRVFPLTPLRKIGIGFFVAGGSFALVACAETIIAAGGTPHVTWQFAAYLVLTAAELLISVTCLEFSYTQAPKALKSLVMAFFLMSVSVGNLFTSAVNWLIQNPDGTSKLAGPSYYWFFVALVWATGALFIPVAMRHREHTYIQDGAFEPEPGRAGDARAASPRSAAPHVPDAPPG